MNLTIVQKETVATAWGWHPAVPYERLFVDEMGAETWERGVEPNPEGASAYFDRKYALSVGRVGAEATDLAVSDLLGALA